MLPALQCTAGLTIWLKLEGRREGNAFGLGTLQQSWSLCRRLLRQPAHVSLAGLATVRHLHLCISSQVSTEGWAALTSLQWLDLQCGARPLPSNLQSSLSSLTGLRHLRLSCTDIELPGISSLSQLTCLDLRECQGLQQLPQIAELAQLQRLDLSSCSSLRSIPDTVSSLSDLELLNLRG